MKKVVVGLLALVVLIVGMWALLPSSQNMHSSQLVASDKAAAQAATNPAAQDAKTKQPLSASEQEKSLVKYVALGRQLGELPASLDGTTVDGHLRVDADGNLLVTVGVRHVFDYFLSTIGEENLEQIKGRIALYIAENLPHEAALQAWGILHRYLGYKRSLVGMQHPKPDGSVADLRSAMRRRNEARVSWLGEATSQAFFGPEEAYDRYTLNRMEVMRNDALSEQERQKKLANLRANLPPQISQMIRKTMGPVHAAQHVETMRQQGATPAEIREYRAQRFGPEAAQRLAELDKRRAKWQSRYQAYRQQRQSITRAGLSQQDQQAQIKALRSRLFSQDELTRVEALDRIRARQSLE